MSDSGCRNETMKDSLSTRVIVISAVVAVAMLGRIGYNLTDDLSLILLTVAAYAAALFFLVRLLWSAVNGGVEFDV